MFTNISFCVLLIFIIWGGTNGDELPSQFKKCSIKDIPCLKDAIQDAFPKLKDGIPSLGVPSLDPMNIPVMEIGAGPSVVKLVQKYKNAQFTGLSTARIDNLIFGIDEGKIVIDWSVDKISLNATYEASGNILVFPVYGNGACTCILEGYSATVQFDIETFMKRGDTHIRGTRSSYLKQNTTHAYFYYDNLFGGNKELGDNINRVINDNWQAIFDELIYGYTDILGQAMMNIMNRLFYKIPMSEMFLV